MKKSNTGRAYRLFVSRTLIISALAIALCIFGGVRYFLSPREWGTSVGIALFATAAIILPTLILFPSVYWVDEKGISIFYIIGGRLRFPWDKVEGATLEYGGISRTGIVIPFIFDTIVIKGEPVGRALPFMDSALPRSAGLRRAIEEHGVAVGGYILTEDDTAARPLLRRAGVYEPSKQSVGEVQAEERRMRTLVRDALGEGAQGGKYLYLFNGKLALRTRPTRRYEYCLCLDGTYLPLLKVRVKGGVHTTKPLYNTADEIRAILGE